jgi:cell division transport system permease protein
MEGVLAGLVGWLVATGLLIVVKSLLLDGLQQYFPFNVQLNTTDLVEVVIIAMIIGLVLCGITSFLTLRRYLRV